MLASGTRLGSFEVIGALGSGGMGDVYRARDTRLGRDVALKVLPDAFAADIDRLARFEREAQLLASLNHPNIAAIHGIEDAGDRRALVLELVHGETLADRIAKGTIPLDETLRIARQIIAAVDAAHEHGIIHRDLKPANIKITPDGTVKVLDFGLAKVTEALIAQQHPVPAQAPTVASPAVMTGVGVLLGTAAYMSPEQARGSITDKRTDIWAFGCIVYEMLTGRRLFDGPTITDALSNVLTKEPTWSDVPVRMRPLLESCLDRDPKRRLRDIGDALRVLDAPMNAPAPRRWPVWIAAALAAVAVAIVVLSVVLRGRSGETPPQPTMRLALDLGKAASSDTDFPITAIAPDASRIVFTTTGADGIARLATRRLDQSDATTLPGTEGAYAPFFSPDSEWIGFFAGGKLKKTRLDGTPPVTLCDASAGRGASWGDDGRIVAALDNRVGLALVSASGGVLAQITKVESGELSHRWPQFLPGGKAIVFMSGSIPGNYARANIAVASLGPGGEWTRKTVATNAGMAPRYLPTGHLVYVLNGTLYAAPFDKDRLEMRGTATPVLEDLSAAIAFGSAQFDVSRDGTALFLTGQRAGRRVLQWMDAAGKTDKLWDDPAVYQFPQVSPDGSRIAAAISDGVNQDIWVYDWRRGNKTRLTSGSGVSTASIWTPDSQAVVFHSAGQLYWARADGAEPPQLLGERESQLRFATSYLPDGRGLFFYEPEPTGGSRLLILPIAGGSGRLRAGKPELFRHLSSSNPAAVVSPDGRWVAYASAESGIYEVYVRAFPDTGRQWQISTRGGVFPVWSRTSKELFYRTEDQLLMMVPYSVANGTFVAEAPRVWSQTRLLNTGLVQNFDLAPDGKRFAVLMLADNAESRGSSQATLSLNFFDQVRRRFAGQ